MKLSSLNLQTHHWGIGGGAKSKRRVYKTMRNSVHTFLKRKDTYPLSKSPSMAQEIRSMVLGKREVGQWIGVNMRTLGQSSTAIKQKLVSEGRLRIWTLPSEKERPEEGGCCNRHWENQIFRSPDQTAKEPRIILWWVSTSWALPLLTLPF